MPPRATMSRVKLLKKASVLPRSCTLSPLSKLKVLCFSLISLYLAGMLSPKGFLPVLPPRSCRVARAVVENALVAIRRHLPASSDILSSYDLQGHLREFFWERKSSGNCTGRCLARRSTAIKIAVCSRRAFCKSCIFYTKFPQDLLSQFRFICSSEIDRKEENWSHELADISELGSKHCSQSKKFSCTWNI